MSVLHVLLVGFHHKKGCQVEYAHPPLLTTEQEEKGTWWPELPAQWKHLPSLALPDGSHHFRSDTSFFHLPALDDPRKTVFGISCFRQIEADKILNKDASITRTTVQKAVCVLSRLPLYGHIEVKMSLITEAFFREADFTRLELIHETFSNLNACLDDEMLRTQQLYVGLSTRDFVRRFRQRALTLFKLALLERRVLFFRSPVSELASFLLTLLSLHPGMLEKGLDEAARMVPADTPSPCSSPMPSIEVVEQPPVENEAEEKAEDAESVVSATGSIVETASEKVGKLKGKLFNYIAGTEEAEEAKEDDENEEEHVLDFQSVSKLHVTSDLALPLRVFTSGNLCHPYLSLSQIDALFQPSVRGYLIGATNALFKTKKGLAEVVVDIGEDKLEVHDAELKQALNLTTEDLRFMEHVLSKVEDEEKVEQNDVFLDGVGWEGGDEWVRSQFRVYLAALLRSSLNNNAYDPSFNATFMRLWTRTQNYRDWRKRVDAKNLREKLPNSSHPFRQSSGLNDVKLHLSNTLTNSESGKRAAQVVSNTGKAVAGGITQAKGAFSSFFSSLRQTAKDEEESEDTNASTKAEEQTRDIEDAKSAGKSEN